MTYIAIAKPLQGDAPEPTPHETAAEAAEAARGSLAGGGSWEVREAPPAGEVGPGVLVDHGHQA